MLGSLMYKKGTWDPSNPSQKSQVIKVGGQKWTFTTHSHYRDEEIEGERGWLSQWQNSIEEQNPIEQSHYPGEPNQCHFQGWLSLKEKHMDTWVHLDRLKNMLKKQPSIHPLHVTEYLSGFESDLFTKAKEKETISKPHFSMFICEAAGRNNSELGTS